MDRARAVKAHVDGARQPPTDTLVASPAASRVQTQTDDELREEMFQYECKLREDTSLTQWQVFEMMEARTRRHSGGLKLSRTDVLRTPDCCFEDLKDWPYEPRYFVSSLFGAEVRMAYYDLGPLDAPETILLTHGEPTWSYVNRRLIPHFLEQGWRVLAFDQVGFGRSDKPAAEADYTYERHVAWNTDLLVNHLDVRGVTALLQDWGGLLGLRVAAAHPSRFRRLVIANTFLPTDEPEHAVPAGFYDWKALCHKTGLKDGVLSVGQLVASAVPRKSSHRLSDEEISAYDAPFPDESFKAGVRRFPELVPTPTSDPTGRPQPLQCDENRAAWQVFKAWQKPVLTAFGDKDAVMAGKEEAWHTHCPGAKPFAHVTIKGAGHFVQDSGGEQLARVVVKFVRSTDGNSPKL